MFNISLFYSPFTPPDHLSSVSMEKKKRGVFLVFFMLFEQIIIGL